MKYFTKEFYKWERLLYAIQGVRQSKNAAQKDEYFYQTIYNNRYDIFKKYEEDCDWYKDPIEERQKIEAYINEPHITEEERNRRIAYKKTHAALNEKTRRNKTVYKFSEERCKHKFEKRQSEIIELYRQMPFEIYQKVADVRLLALGYASPKVIQLLRPYRDKLRRTIQKIKKAAFAETDKTESLLPHKLGLNECDNFCITAIERTGGNVSVKGENGFCLTVQNGRIIEGMGHAIYPFYEESPIYPQSRILAIELHRTEELFELHFLVSNDDEYKTQELWYLTVSGTNIVKID
ncbi:MAG: hypothetical protein HFE25_02385 [Clostridia bacterium]|jgi:hypothetical protein|nr:hypothetical protein [Clostridia bacterium]